jgi:hypothetical protein
MLVSAPLVEAKQDGSIRIQDLTKVVMARKRLGLAKERLVPFEAARDVPYANDRPCAFHRICAVGPKACSIRRSPRSFFRRVLERAQGLMSDEHSTVDGTLIEAWASQKSFQWKGREDHGDGKNFHGQTRTNDTHASKTDPDANCIGNPTAPSLGWRIWAIC